MCGNALHTDLDELALRKIPLLDVVGRSRSKRGPVVSEKQSRGAKLFGMQRQCTDRFLVVGKSAEGAASADVPQTDGAVVGARNYLPCHCRNNTE